MCLKKSELCWYSHSSSFQNFFSKWHSSIGIKNELNRRNQTSLLGLETVGKISTPLHYTSLYSFVMQSQVLVNLSTMQIAFWIIPSTTLFTFCVPSSHKVKEILEGPQGGGMNEDGTCWTPKPWSQEEVFQVLYLIIYNKKLLVRHMSHNSPILNTSYP